MRIHIQSSFIIIICEYAIYLYRKVAKSPRGKGKKKNKGQSANGNQKLCDIKKGISIDELNDVITRCNLVVPGFETDEPTYKQACIDVATSILWAAGEVLFHLRWLVKYKVLKQDYTEEDKEYLCRTHHKKTEIELRFIYNSLLQIIYDISTQFDINFTFFRWNTMSEKDRLKLMNKSGIWNRRERENEEKSKKNKKKRN